MILQLLIVYGQMIVVTSQKVSNYGFFAVLMSCSLQESAVCMQATQCVQKVTIATLDLSLADAVWTFVFSSLTIWDLELGS